MRHLDLQRQRQQDPSWSKFLCFLILFSSPGIASLLPVPVFRNNRRHDQALGTSEFVARAETVVSAWALSGGHLFALLFYCRRLKLHLPTPKTKKKPQDILCFSLTHI